MPVSSPLTSVAIRCHHMELMEAFYRDAFGFEFRTVRTGPFPSRFGEAGGFTLKLVPIRDGTDFEDFPIHQLGFHVPDIDRAVMIAEEHRGRVVDEPTSADGVRRASVRDPDGNTVELSEAG